MLYQKVLIKLLSNANGLNLAKSANVITLTPLQLSLDKKY